MDSNKLVRRLQSGARFAARVAKATSGQPSSSSQHNPAETETTRPPDGVYLFDASGQWIAYRQDIYLYRAATNGLLGYLPFPDNHVADRDGSYLCTIVDDRLWRQLGEPWSNAGAIPFQGAGTPPPPITTLLSPTMAPAGFGPFSLP